MMPGQPMPMMGGAPGAQPMPAAAPAQPMGAPSAPGAPGGIVQMLVQNLTPDELAMLDQLISPQLGMLLAKGLPELAPMMNAFMADNGGPGAGAGGMSDMGGGMQQGGMGMGGQTVEVPDGIGGIDGNMPMNEEERDETMRGPSALNGIMAG